MILESNGGGWEFKQIRLNEQNWLSVRLICEFFDLDYEAQTRELAVSPDVEVRSIRLVDDDGAVQERLYIDMPSATEWLDGIELPRRRELRARLEEGPGVLSTEQRLNALRCATFAKVQIESLLDVLMSTGTAENPGPDTSPKGRPANAWHERV
jgi:hypothetical protein